MKLSDQVAELEGEKATLLKETFKLSRMLVKCAEYLECIPETSAGGDDEALDLAREVRKLLTGR
jgi:hypothetical protein